MGGKGGTVPVFSAYFCGTLVFYFGLFAGLCFWPGTLLAGFVFLSDLYMFHTVSGISEPSRGLSEAAYMVSRYPEKPTGFPKRGYIFYFLYFHILGTKKELSCSA